MSAAAYLEFLSRKSPLIQPSGIADVPPLHDAMKPFQAAITAWALRRGRAAIFAGTGLGKTLMQLVWARAVADHEQHPVLILTPLAVAEQTVAEAERWGIRSVAYAPMQAQAATDIVVSNYERFDKFEINNFCGIVLDESGVLKSHDGKTRVLLTDRCQPLRWRLCCTATPAPNDYTEMGQHAEFLGVMNFKEMLSMFFVHDGKVRAPGADGVDGWRLKRHAINDFWRWLASWSVMIRSPEDLGFDGAEYQLPPLHLFETRVAVEYQPGDGMLFPVEARTLSERIRARKTSVHDRVCATVGLVEAEPNEAWLVWCNLNAEADLIERQLAHLGARQIKGADPTQVKVERLLGFKNSRPPILITKPSIAGHGMQYSHCARAAFVGLTDSFEQTYQAIRRCWRFGQTRPVHVHMVASELEGAVVANLRRKELDFDRMLDAMSGHMRDLMRESVIGHRHATDQYQPTQRMTAPW
jgi:SNF2-related domain